MMGIVPMTKASAMREMSMTIAAIAIAVLPIAAAVAVAVAITGVVAIAALVAVVGVGEVGALRVGHVGVRLIITTSVTTNGVFGASEIDPYSIDSIG